MVFAWNVKPFYCHESSVSVPSSSGAFDDFKRLTNYKLNAEAPWLFNTDYSFCYQTTTRGLAAMKS